MVFYFSKWLCFSTACVVMISAGLAYTFSIYSHDLKMHFALTQQQVNGLGTAGNLGGYLALPAGLFYDSLKSRDRLGPMLTIAVGVILNFGGYFAIWTAISGYYTPKYWQLLLLLLVACNGQTWFETAALVTTVRNFETERGTVIGILKAMLGLSASVYIAIYVAFLEPHVRAFILLLAILPCLLAILLAPFINFVPFRQQEPHTKSHAFHMVFTAVIGLAIYQGVIAAARNAEDLDTWSGVLMIAAMAILLLPILAVPLIFGGLRAKRLKAKVYPELIKAAEAGGLNTEELDQPLLGLSSSGPRLGPYRSKTPWQCLRSSSFWMLLVVNAIGSGAGLALLNNLGEQTVALQGDHNISSAVFVSMFSIANCLGRLASGFIPDKLMRKRSLARTSSLVFLSFMTIAASVLNSIQSVALIGPASLLSGFAFGGLQGVCPAVASELFGLKHFATNYALIQLGPALGSYFMATYLAGSLYDRAASKFHDRVCRGTGCFMWTFIIVSVFAALGLALSVLLHLRTAHLYERVVEDTRIERSKRGREAETAAEKFMLWRTQEENNVLRSFMVRYQSLLTDLQRVQMELPDAAQQVASNMHGLSREADRLIESHNRLWEAYSSLPSTPRQGLLTAPSR